MQVLMQHSHNASSFAVPEWLLFVLSALFLIGACFYIYRLLRPAKLQAVYGYWDWQNELGHAICMAAMASMLAPLSWQLPSVFWLITLTVGGTAFLLRALTWGRKLAYNKWWYDWVHVAMMYGMALMFYPLALGAWFTLAQIAFWGWFAGYYFWQTCKDAPGGKALYLGSDLSHLLMGVVMLLMTLFPAAMMPMAHMATTVTAPAVRNPVRVEKSGVYVLDDSNFAGEIDGTQQPVVLLFFGGCEKCAQEVKMLNDIAPQFSGRLKMARINTDHSPLACQRFNIKDCPVIVVIKKNTVITATAADVTDNEALRRFIEKSIR